MRYVISSKALVTGTTPGTFKTLLALKLADTAGHRARLRGIHVGGDLAPDDIQVTVKIDTTTNLADGTSSDVTSTIAQKKVLGIATRVSYAGKNYSTEPTTFNSRKLFQRSCHTRGGLQKEWPDSDDAPEWGKNETLCVLATIGNGTTAANLTIELEWEEH